MARKPMVTRTIQTTKATVLCLDVKAEKPFEQEFTLPRTYKDDKSVLKAVEAVLGTADVKAVHIVSTVVEETLYGMTEQKFLENAVKMVDRNTLPSVTESEENSSEEADEAVEGDTALDEQEETQTKAKPKTKKTK